MLFGVYCALSNVRCVLFVVCCLMCVGAWPLFLVGSSLSVVCRLLFVVLCVLVVAR